MTLNRRDFLKRSGYFFAAASLSGVSGGGCGGEDAPPGTFAFPQGVASGDPREDSVVLWTRVERTNGGTDSVSVVAQVSETEDFETLVVDEAVRVTAGSDHTLRLVVTGLAPSTTYFYRFLAGLDESRVGRTLTAPPRDDDAPVRLAWVSCQDFGAGTFGAYRELIKDDDARPAADKIQLVVHVGDFIYETTGGRFQIPLDDAFQPTELIDLRGNPREVAPFPSGGGALEGEERFAQTVDDYRHLYKQFLADPDLQDARARWPFAVVWDDHEFTDDSWQTQANYQGGSLDEPSQTRKLAANQAWFEYIPAHLTGADGVPGVTQDAADFTPADVEDAAYGIEVNADNQVTEPNNVAAIDSLTIYRSIRYGKNVELVLTDGRSYRSDHPVLEESIAGNLAFFHPRAVMSLELVNEFDAGMTANGGMPRPQVLAIDNPRVDSPPGTMLGPDQKQWWKDTMQGSDATWKLWANQVPLMRVLTRDEGGILFFDRVMTSDAWDGYPSERNELMQFLRDNGVDNVVVISGDIHAHFAGLVMDDHDADPAMQQPVVAEFCAAGVASNSLFSFFEDASRPLPPQVRELVTYDAKPLGGADSFVENLNTLFMHGMVAAQVAAQTHDVAQVVAATDPTLNPHLRYADTNAQGYGVLTVAPGQVTASLVTINRPIVDTGEDGPGIRRTATFSVDAGDVTSLIGPEFSGAPPFPFA